MLKETQTPRHASGPTHRTYTPQFKADLVAQCQHSGASIAALATRHAMNANVLHRWLKEHALQGRHQLTNPMCADTSTGTRAATSPSPAFIPVKLGAVLQETKLPEIRVELQKGALSMNITWPISATADFVQWSTAVLQ